MYGLTKKEHRLFDLLLDHEVLTRETALVELDGVPEDLAPRIKTRSVDMTISRIRRKIPFTIETVRGVGFRLLVG